ncbi:MAG: hypothetical protein OXU23_08140 [Candidatus Poribacteria bacterium]|nr:hypothetical protein [Candidatus Poribacteria bacterium]
MEKFNLLSNNSNSWTMFGNRISQVRAREMFPMLVARAKERKTISYGELTEHFDLAWAMPMMYAVVCTTGTLYDLERNKLPQAQFAWTHGKIPRIANMVTKSNGAPAGFVADQLPYQEPPIDFDMLLKKIWDYDKWDEVQKALGLSG